MWTSYGAISQPATYPLNDSLSLGLPAETIQRGWPSADYISGTTSPSWRGARGNLHVCHMSSENLGSAQPRSSLIFLWRPASLQLQILALSFISGSVIRVCFHLPLLQIITLWFYIYDQLFKGPLEGLTTAQLSITAIITCLFVFRKQHRLENAKTAFGVEQLCFGGRFSPCCKCVTLKHISIHLQLCHIAGNCE